MTTNTIANLTTEQITAYTNEYKELTKKSIKSFDQKEFEAHYEAVKAFYLEDKVSYDNRYNDYLYKHSKEEGALSLARHKATTPSTICHLAGLLKHKYVNVSGSTVYGCLNPIIYAKTVADYLEANKDFVLCTNTEINFNAVLNSDELLKGVFVTATKEKQKSDLKDLKKLTLDLYKEYIEINNQEALKEISTIEDYIQKQEAKKNAAKLAEIQAQLMEEQQKAIDTAVEEIYMLEEDYEFDIATLESIKADVAAQHIPNKFKMKDLIKSLAVSIGEGKIDSIDINNDRVVSETLKAQGFEKKHTNTGSVWVVA